MRVGVVLALSAAVAACSVPLDRRVLVDTPPEVAVPPPQANYSRRIVYDGSGRFTLPDGSVVASDPDGGFTLPNGAYVGPNAAGGVTLPNGAQCVSDGAGGYACP